MNEKQKKKMETKARLLKRLADYAERKKAMDNRQNIRLEIFKTVYVHFDGPMARLIDVMKQYEKYIVGEETDRREYKCPVCRKSIQVPVNYIEKLRCTCPLFTKWVETN